MGQEQEQEVAQDKATKMKGSEKRKEMKRRHGVVMSLQMDSTPYEWRPQACWHLSYCDRTQDIEQAQ